MSDPRSPNDALRPQFRTIFLIVINLTSLFTNERLFNRPVHFASRWSEKRATWKLQVTAKVSDDLNGVFGGKAFLERVY